MSYKQTLTALAILLSIQASAQTCFSISNRSNGNGNSGTCGSSPCSGNVKTGHIDINYGASCPAVIPSLILTSVSSGTLPNPFCFDAGNCISPGIVRYCFRGTNLPGSGFMNLRMTQGATTWNCNYSVNGGSGQILPVKLAGFEATLNQQKVILKWKTEQEINNHEFQIQRSTDNSSFSTIGTVAGTGTTSLTQLYSFVDADPVKGISFYRLRQVDIDGNFRFSSIVRIDNRVKGLAVQQLFPNPATTVINLELQADDPGIVSASIYTMDGKQVLATRKNMLPGKNNWVIQLTGLAAGIYEIVIRNEAGAILTEKMMIY